MLVCLQRSLMSSLVQGILSNGHSCYAPWPLCFTWNMVYNHVFNQTRLHFIGRVMMWNCFLDGWYATEAIVSLNNPLYQCHCLSRFILKIKYLLGHVSKFHVLMKWWGQQLALCPEDLQYWSLDASHNSYLSKRNRTTIPIYSYKLTM